MGDVMTFYSWNGERHLLFRRFPGSSRPLIKEQGKREVFIKAKTSGLEISVEEN
jgi:hypothetical protein